VMLLDRQIQLDPASGHATLSFTVEHNLVVAMFAIELCTKSNSFYFVPPTYGRVVGQQ
jgi:hypothetical protein